MKVKVLVDSCGDVSEQIMETFDIGMVPLNIKLGKIMLDRIDISPEEYYERINDYDVPETSSPNLAQWKAAFDTYLLNGYDKIVVVTLSSKLSNTHDQACVAAKKFYPEDIKVLDSRQASGAEGLVAIKFRDLLNKGYSFEDTYKEMEKTRNDVILIGYMENLKMLLKSGRISRASEFIASLGKMKPMVTTDEGELIPLCKVISLKNAKKRMIIEILEKADRIKSYSLFVTHANDAETAYELKEQVERELNISKSFVNFMGPVVGSRVGLKAQIISIIPDIEQ
jgi:DegV family protein with EDD domain